MQIEADSAQVTTPPPVYFLSAVLAGLLLQIFFPAHLGLGGIQFSLGLFFSILSFLALVYCNLLFKKVGTNIAPWKSSTHLMTDGVYGLSRNPIYASFIILCAGLGLASDNAWMLVAAGLLAVALRKLVIAKEEAYLEKKFGEDYRKYKGSVRRWL